MPRDIICQRANLNGHLEHLTAISSSICANKQIDEQQEVCSKSVWPSKCEWPQQPVKLQMSSMANWTAAVTPGWSRQGQRHRFD